MFKVIKGDYLPDSGLMTELPGVTTARMVELFGPRCGQLDPGAKYSERVLVQSIFTKEKFSLYMCYGEWRIGGKWPCRSIHELEKYIRGT